MTLITTTIIAANIATATAIFRQRHPQPRPSHHSTVRRLRWWRMILFHILLVQPQQQVIKHSNRQVMISQQRTLTSLVGAFVVNPLRTCKRPRHLQWSNHHHISSSNHFQSSFRYHLPQPQQQQRKKVFLSLQPHDTFIATIPIKRRRTNFATLSASSTTFLDEDDHETTITLPPNSTTVVEDSINELTKNWRTHPTINPTIRFPTWICHQGQHIQSILQSSLLQPYLATQLDLLQHLHVRFRVVRKYSEFKPANHPTPGRHPTILESTRFIVLHPDTPKISHLPTEVQVLLQSIGCSDTYVESDEDTELPYVVHFSYHQFTASYILNRLLPVAVHPVPTAFETVGHVAHLNLKPHHYPYRQLIGQVLLETLPNIETVIQKIGDVSGPFRTFQYEVLAGKENHTLVQLVESGASLQFDLQHVYWCSRLSEERQRLLQQEILKTTTRNKDAMDAPNRTIVLADVFCGVGALCMQAAMAHSHVEIWANDWNPYATAALRKNAIRNGVSHQVTRLTTDDAYQFLMDLGMTTVTPPLATLESNTNRTMETLDVAPLSPLELTNHSKSRKGHPRRRYHRRKSHPVDAEHHKSETSIREEGMIRLPDHVVMNFPLESPNFLGALRWWPANECGHGNGDDSSGLDQNIGLVTPRIHVYTFARNSVNDNNHKYDDDDDDSNNDTVQGDKVGNLNDRSVEEIAVDLVADQLLPQLSPRNNLPQYSTNGGRRHELNDVYDCNVRTHIVRDVAPGKVVVCVSFTVTSKLLRHMRGDFL